MASTTLALGGPVRLGPAGFDAALAAAAVAALSAEARLTPKPGLVDRANTGAHTDMDLALLLRSARTLGPWFARLARAAAQHARPGPDLRAELAAIGRAAEAAMLVATGGVNTHRGAIWALGLLVAGAALRPGAPAAEIAATAGAIARFPDRAAPPGPGPSHGELAGAAYGVSGARGQAEAAFPHVIGVALPELLAARDAGADPDTAALSALLGLLVTLDDTCVLHRGGRPGLRTVQRGAARVRLAGGPASPAGRVLLHRLDRRLSRRRLSPGGCADLLAAALLLDSLDRLAGPAGRRTS